MDFPVFRDTFDAFWEKRSLWSDPEGADVCPEREEGSV